MSEYELIISDQDKTNLLRIMNEATIQGLANAKALVDLAQKINDAPARQVQVEPNDAE